MIVFTLRCGEGHEFEEWFGSGADYEARKAAATLACPQCGDQRVEKAIMAPNVASGGRGKEAPPPLPCGQGGCGGGACAFAGGDF